MGSISCFQARRENNQNYSWDSNGFWDFKILPTDGNYQLTESELYLVKQKWKLLISDKTIRAFAYTLFEKLFLTFPDNSKLLFVADTKAFISSQQWKEHRLFAQHIRELVNALGTIIYYLDKEESLREYMYNLEEFHRSLRGMKKYYIEVFVRVIDDSMVENFGSIYNGNTKLAFRKVLAMVYYSLTWRLLV